MIWMKNSKPDERRNRNYANSFQILATRGWSLESFADSQNAGVFISPTIFCNN